MGALKIELARACAITEIPGEHPWDFCERAFQANGNAYYTAIQASFDTEAPLWDARAYKHLVQIPFKSYVTPNYDTQLPRAFSDKYPNIVDLFSVYPGSSGDGIGTAQPADLEHKRRLVAIHGYADPNNPEWPKQIILKTSDYNDHYAASRTSRYLFNWWKNLLIHLPCVFIGMSLKEPGLHRVIEELRKDGNPKLESLNHIHLVSAVRSENDPNHQLLTPTFGVFQKIAYDQIDQRHSGLLNVLSEFSKIPTKDPSPGLTQVRPISLNDRFDF